MELNHSDNEEGTGVPNVELIFLIKTYSRQSADNVFKGSAFDLI